MSIIDRVLERFRRKQAAEPAPVVTYTSGAGRHVERGPTRAPYKLRPGPAPASVGVVVAGSQPAVSRAPVWEAPVGATVEWYTPPTLFAALGLSFDLDPAAPPGGVPWVPAHRYFTAEDNGLWQPWRGRVWLNPPYEDVEPWVDRIVAHGDGMLLVFSRTETRAWQKAAAAATALALLRDRLYFIRGDGYQGRPAAGSTLFAFGPACAAALTRADLGWTWAR